MPVNQHEQQQAQLDTNASSSQSHWQLSRHAQGCTFKAAEVSTLQSTLWPMFLKMSDKVQTNIMGSTHPGCSAGLSLARGPCSEKLPEPVPFADPREPPATCRVNTEVRPVAL